MPVTRTGGSQSHPRRQLLAPLLLWIASGPIPVAAAIAVSMSAVDTQRALRLAGAADPVRALFHAPYTIPVKDSVIQSLEVLTPYRRTVMAAEDAAKRGDWAVAHGAQGLSGHSVEETVKPWQQKVTIRATLQLNAMHTFVTVPNCEIMMGGLPVIASLDRRTTPVSSLPSTHHKVTTTALLGALIEADFDVAGVGQTTRDVVVLCEGRDVARAAIDFSRLE
jgi:hypothetical protein